MPELDLEAELRDLGATLDVADDDTLAMRVVAILDRSTSPAPVVVRSRRRLAAAVVAIAVAGASALAAPAVADWLRQRIGGVEVRRVPTTVSPSLPTTLELGRPTTLRDAETEAGFAIKRL